MTWSLKEVAKKGDNDVCKFFAKEIANSRRAGAKLSMAKARLDSIQRQMRSQMCRRGGPLQINIGGMKNMLQLVKLPEIRKSMMELSKEMVKEGVIKDMLDDIKEENEEETMNDDQEEVDNIIVEITTGRKEKDLPNSEDRKKDDPVAWRMGENITKSTDVTSGVSKIISKDVILDTDNEINSAKKGRKGRRHRRKVFTLDQIARM